MWSRQRYAIIVVSAGLLTLGLTSNQSPSSNLRRKLQQVAPPQSLWATSGSSGGFQQVGSSYGSAQGVDGGYGAPQQTGGYGSTQQSGGYGMPEQGGGGYGAPPPQQDVGGYGAPQQGYGAPQQGYGTPQEGYGAPQEGYGAPQQESSGGYGMPQQQSPGMSEAPREDMQGGYGSSQLETPMAYGEKETQQEGGYDAPEAQDEGEAPPPKKKKKKKSSTSAVSDSFAPESSHGSDAACLREAQEIPATPTWLASFPGSGIKELWKTMEQLTGAVTTDDNDPLGRLKKGNAVGVKTHFPTSHVSPKFFVMDTSRIQTAVLLIRNPLEVMHEYFKFIYHYEHQSDPSKEIPVDKWVFWRNANLNEQIANWTNFVNWWVENYGSTGKLVILPYERFTGPGGVDSLKNLGAFLSQVDPNVDLAPESNLECIWENTVALPIADEKARTKHKHPGYQFPFTVDQLELMTAEVKKLKKSHARNPVLQDVLGEYIKQITGAKRAVEKLLDG